jgi:hypothetical protein
MVKFDLNSEEINYCVSALETLLEYSEDKDEIKSFKKLIKKLRYKGD